MKVLFVFSGNDFDYFRGDIQPQVKIVSDALIKKGVEIQHLSLKGKGVLGYLANFVRLATLLFKTKNYDLIHLHNGLMGIIGFHLCFKYPVIVSYMGSDLIGSVDDFGRYKKNKRLLVHIYRFISKFALNYSIVKSKEMLRLLNIKNAIVIPNGVDLSIFHPKDKTIARTKLNIDINKKIVLFVGDIKNPVKNYRLAKESISILNEILALEEEVSLFPIYGLMHEALCDFYNAADVLLLTSFHEGSPNVIKEAMACNCPIVATNVGDVYENIALVKNTYVTNFDPFQIAQALKNVILSNSKSNGRDFCTRLSSENMAENIIGVYEKLDS